MIWKFNRYYFSIYNKLKKKFFFLIYIWKKSSAPHEGIEPSTTSLKGWRSTVELTRLLDNIIIFKFLKFYLKYMIKFSKFNKNIINNILYFLFLLLK